MRYSLPVSLPPDKVAATEPFVTAGDTPGFSRLFRLAALWRERVDRPARRAAVAIAVASIFALAHLARVGSPAARVATLVVLVGIWAGLVVRALVNRRAWRDPKRVVERTILSTNAD